MTKNYIDNVEQRYLGSVVCYFDGASDDEILVYLDKELTKPISYEEMKDLLLCQLLVLYDVQDQYISQDLGYFVVPCYWRDTGNVIFVDARNFEGETTRVRSSVKDTNKPIVVYYYGLDGKDGPQGYAFYDEALTQMVSYEDMKKLLINNSIVFVDTLSFNTVNPTYGTPLSWVDEGTYIYARVKAANVSSFRVMSADKVVATAASEE